MSIDTNKTNNTPEPEVENQTASNLSNKDKFVRFFKDNTKMIAIVSGVILSIVLIIILYFALFNKSMDTLAEEFCTCASAQGSDFYAYSNDGFGYRSDLVGCFAEDFRTYGKRYNKATKKDLLIKFQEAVVEKCPEKLADVFEYK